MKIDLESIEATARKAQEECPGEWTKEPGSIGSVVFGKASDICVADCWSDGMAEHIAQCSPDVVIALVARIYGAENRIRELENSMERIVGRCDKCGCLLDGICDCPGFGR